MQINLLPWRQKQAQRQLRRWYQRVLSAVMSGGLLLIAAAATLQPLYQGQQQRWHKARRQVAAQPSHPEERWRQQLRQQYQRSAYLLEQLPQLIPQGVYLRELQWQPMQFTLKGTTLNYPLLISVIDRLQRHPLNDPPQYRASAPCTLSSYHLQAVRKATNNPPLITVQFTLQLRCHCADHSRENPRETRGPTGEIRAWN